jgi:hypothetical protein
MAGEAEKETLSHGVLSFRAKVEIRIGGELNRPLIG